MTDEDRYLKAKDRYLEAMERGIRRAENAFEPDSDEDPREYEGGG